MRLFKLKIFHLPYNSFFASKLNLNGGLNFTMALKIKVMATLQRNDDITGMFFNACLSKIIFKP